MKRMERMWMVVLCVLVAAGAVSASPIVVEKPKDSATVFVQFKDGASFEFEVFFDTPEEGESITGVDLLDMVAGGTSMEVSYEIYSFGEFLDGISYGGHSNDGDDAEDLYNDWWHYYVAEEGDAGWTAPGYGAGGRTVVDGSMDAWVYGSAAAPALTPEPATMALLAIGGLVALARRKNRS